MHIFFEVLLLFMLGLLPSYEYIYNITFLVEKELVLKLKWKRAIVFSVESDSQQPCHSTKISQLPFIKMSQQNVRRNQNYTTLCIRQHAKVVVGDIPLNDCSKNTWKTYEFCYQWGILSDKPPFQYVPRFEMDHKIWSLLITLLFFLSSVVYRDIIAIRPLLPS